MNYNDFDELLSATYAVLQQVNYDELLLNQAFGNGYNSLLAKSIFTQWGQGDFGNLPPIYVMPGENLNGANGAYSSHTKTIYISQEFFESNNLESLRNLLLEEIAHYVDSQINIVDAKGDEGAIFADLVQGKSLTEAELAALKAENDWGVITIDGISYYVEQDTQTLTVNTIMDQNDGSSDIGDGLSLRDAIIIANSNLQNEYIIELVGGETYTLTIGASGEDATQGELDILGNITIKTVGNDPATIDAKGIGGGDRVFYVDGNAILTLENLIVTGGNLEEGTGDGGGIYNDGILNLINTHISSNRISASYGYGGGIYNNGTANIINSTLNDNFARNGGGIYNPIGGNLTLINATVSGNKAADDGGGIYNDEIADLTNSTITNNSADSDSDGDGNGGGIINSSYAESITLKNTIVAKNFTQNTDSDISGEEISGNLNNLIGNLTGASGTIGTGTDIVNPDPKLGELQDNGGPTKTHALLPDSPAINGGDNGLIAQDILDLDEDGDTSEAVLFDQRGNGFPRIVNDTVDIGAVEGSGGAIELLGKHFNVIQEPLNVGDTFNVQFEVENKGAGNAQEFAVNFYVSDDNLISTGDKFIGNYQINNLPGNNQTTGIRTINLTLPEGGDEFWGESGSYYLGMIVDGDEEISETDEDNNSNQGEWKDSDRVEISVNPSQPDLVGSLFDVVQEPLNSGDNFEVKFEVENQAAGTAGQFEVKFYLSDNETIWDTDKLLGSYKVGNLLGNSKIFDSVNLTLPAGSDSFWQGTGEYYVGMMIDTEGLVSESDEGNNYNIGEWKDFDGVDIAVNGGVNGIFASADLF